MLVNLTPIESEIERRRQIAKENNFEYLPQSDPKWLKEKGIYISSFPFNFPEEEFEELKDLTWEEKFKQLYYAFSQRHITREEYEEELWFLNFINPRRTRVSFDVI